MKNYRDFIFAKLGDEGLSFEDYFGESLSSLDNMVDRSPEGRLEVAGGVFRYMHRCNWKMLVENLTDTCHPMVAHESSAGTALDIWKRQPEGAKKHPAVEIYGPFMSPYEFFEGMGIRVWPNGHGHTGVKHSIHSDYSEIPGYFEAMKGAYGEERAKAILGENRHNTVYFPNMTLKARSSRCGCSSRSPRTGRWSKAGRSASSARPTNCFTARCSIRGSSMPRPRSSAMTISKCTSGRRKG